MALPDIATLTESELQALASLVSSRLEQAERDAEQTEADIRADLAQAVGRLDALIGPDSPTTPALDSITEVQLFTDAQMADNAGLAFRLVFVGMEQLARATRDIARIAGRTA